MSGRWIRRCRSQGGAAAVEFALVAPLILLLVFGMISYGYLLSFRQAISQGASEGARAAAVTLSTPGGTQQADAARNALNDALASYGITCSGTNLVKGGVTVGSCLTAVAPCSNDTSKSCAKVTVNYGYREHPLVPSFPGLGIVLPAHLAYTAVAQVS